MKETNRRLKYNKWEGNIRQISQGMLPLKEEIFELKVNGEEQSALWTTGREYSMCKINNSGMILVFMKKLDTTQERSWYL